MGRPGPVVKEPEPGPGECLRAILEPEEGTDAPMRLTLFPRDLSHQRLLEGVEEGEALRRLRSLFHLCGKAQERLAFQALRAARGKPLEEPFQEGEILRESLFESLRSLLLPINGEAILPFTEKEAWRHLRDLGRKDRHSTESSFFTGFRTLLEGVVLGESVFRFLARGTAGDWDDWLRDRRMLSPVVRKAALLAPEGEGAIPFLPELSLQDAGCLEQLARAMDDREFLSWPHLEGEGRETGPLAREREHPLVWDLWMSGRSLSARLAARLVELARWSKGEKDGGGDKARLAEIRSRSQGDGVGIAWGETSRGLLVHRWTLREGRVRGVRILAPTEWTFSPEGGAFASWCSALSRKRSSGRGLRALVADSLWVFDPCAPVVVRERALTGGMDGRDA